MNYYNTKDQDLPDSSSLYKFNKSTWVTQLNSAAGYDGLIRMSHQPTRVDILEKLRKIFIFITFNILKLLWDKQKLTTQFPHQTRSLGAKDTAATNHLPIYFVV